MSEPSSGSGFTVQVAGRTVVVRTGTKSQTVNICSSANLAGDYETRFRLDFVNAITDESDLTSRASLDELRAWLLERNGREEDPTGRTTPLPPVPAAASDPWLAEAVGVVDTAIDGLVTEFLLHPYRHRVEHSLHTELVTSLMSHPRLGGLHPLQDGPETQLVHKEWPETAVRRDRERTVERRGLFDVVVLSPDQLAQTSTDQFRQGRVEAPIVVELGLDYGAGHLDGDVAKFRNSDVPYGRLVHLGRLPSGRAAVEHTVNALGSGSPRIRVAYGYRDRGGQTAVKLLAEASVHSAGQV